MNKFTKHAILVLQKKDDWVSKADLEESINEYFEDANEIETQKVFSYLQNRANIGFLKGKYRWYPWKNGVDDKTQALLDHGEF